MPTPVLAKTKLQWVRELTRLEHALQAMRSRVEALTTIETPQTLQYEADNAHGWHEKVWRDWFEKATAWCALHQIARPEDLFARWRDYLVQAGEKGSEAWARWTHHFLWRYQTRTGDRDTENRILASIWRQQQERLAQAHAFGWCMTTPELWPLAKEVGTALENSTQCRGSTKTRLVDYFDFVIDTDHEDE